MVDIKDILLYSHALSEVFIEFTTTNKTFKECATLYNAEDKIDEMLSLSFLNIVLDNFCNQKDEYWNYTNDEDYSMKLSAYDFKFVEILNDEVYSKKKIIKEIRDSLEHLSYDVSSDLSYIFIDNKKTGFKSKIDIRFFSTSCYAFLNSRGYNLYLVDNNSVDYNKDFDYNKDRIRVYRLISKKKSDYRVLDYLSKNKINELDKAFFNSSCYVKETRNLDENQKILLKEYFENHEFNHENLALSLYGVTIDGTGFSNLVNIFMEFFILGLFSLLENGDYTVDELKSNEYLVKSIKSAYKFSDLQISHMFELVQNYFKMHFIKKYYLNMEHENEEEKHIRNSLCHLRYTIMPSKNIILCDHSNGVRNEKNTTFYKFMDLDELYNKTVSECFENEKSFYFKRK